MLHKIINYITPIYTNLKDSSVFIWLFAVSFFIRFPFFFRDYIDRDESTFILMGQSLVDGHLPYTELWDLKPPIIFLVFASLIYTFGKSFFAIRLFGALIVAITALFSYKTATLLTTKKVSFWIAICCICLQSMFGSLQGVMSEHLCVVFFMPGLYLITKYNKHHWVFIAGVFMGLSLMTKLNMTYVIFFLGIYLFYLKLQIKEYKKAFLNALLLGLGILVTILLTVVPYYSNGNTEIWWDSVILAPLKYVDANAKRYSVFKFVPICVVLGVFFLFSWKKKLLNFKDITIKILIATIIGIVFSFIKSGKINGHYLIQLHPVLIILIGILISKIEFLKKINYKPYITILLLLLPVETYLEYVNICKNKIEKNTFYNGEGFTVTEYIKTYNLDTKNILFLTYHIGYWILDKKPITKAATHPSNICRDELFPLYKNPRKNSMEEIKHIMEEIKPKTIIAKKNRGCFDKKLVEENEYMNAYLSKHYKKLTTVDNAQIFYRLK